MKPSIRWQRLGVNTKLILIYGSLMAVFVFLLSTVSYFGTRQIVAQKGLANIRGVMEQVRNNADTNLRQIDKLSYVVFADREILRVLKANPEDLETIDSRERWLVERSLTDLLFAREDISGIVLYNNAGSSIRTRLTRPEISFEEIREVADEADGRMAWLSNVEELDTLPAVRRVYDMELHPVGYLRVDLRTSDVRAHLSEEIRARGGMVAVVDGDEVVLTDRGDSADVAEFAGLERAMTLSDSAIDFEVTGDAILVSVPSRVTSWRFVGSVPLRSVYGDIRRIRDFTIGTSAIAAICFIVVSGLVARRFTRPLREIAEQMQAASLTDWRPTLTYSGSDEIAYLGTQFHEMIERINTLVAELVEEKSRHARQQLNALQAQINPHFLYNTLDVVSWMARRNNADDVAQVVAALSRMMRYSISSSDSATIGTELNHVREYVTIQRARFKDRFSVELDVDPDVLDTPIPKLTLQPLVENAIVHGLRQGKATGSIAVRARATRGEATLVVEDSGCGIDEARLATLLHNPSSHDGRGIGIANVNRRLMLTFGEPYGLSISSVAGEGTRCVVSVPMRRVTA
jgi:two-component system sensor histidine kinase YesM